MDRQRILCAAALQLLFTLVLTVLSVPASAAAGAEAGEGDRAAVEAYRNMELDRAEGLWLDRLEHDDLAGSERGRLLYNLGNVSFRRGDLHEAVGYYTASLRHRPRHAPTWANLELARSEAGLEPRDRGDLAATVDRLLESFTLAESEWLVVLALVLFGLALLGEALFGGRFWRRLCLGGVALVALAALPWAVHLLRAGDDPVLLVGEGRVALHSEPRREATMVSEVEVGAELQRLDELPGWVQVRSPEGYGAWVAEERAFALVR